MQQRVDTTLIVDGDGGAHLEGSVTIPPGRHRVIVLVDDARPREAWDAFIEQTYGSLAKSDLSRPTQGHYEQRDEIA